MNKYDIIYAVMYFCMLIAINFIILPKIFF